MVKENFLIFNNFLQKKGLKNRIELITFGKPRVGNKEFSEYAKKTIRQHFRVVNRKDIGKKKFFQYVIFIFQSFTCTSKIFRLLSYTTRNLVSK